MDINNYFDKIIIVNLDERPDRMKQMELKLKHNNITNFIRFSAINPKSSKYNLKIPHNFYESIGAYGMLCSAYHILLYAIKQQFKRILILEDDIIFHKDFNQQFKIQINFIPNDWYLFYLGTSLHQWRFKERCKFSNHYFQSKGTIAGAFSVGIDHKIYHLLIQYILTLNMAWDTGPLTYINKLYPNKCFISNPYLVIANTSDSNIRNNKTLEYKAKQCNWNLSLYHRKVE